MRQARRLFEVRPNGMLSLSGYCAEYVDVGVGDPIIVLPGLMGGIGLLSPLIRRLSRHHRVISYQFRGESQSVFDRKYGLERLTDDLDQVIAQLNLERPGLVGVSFGGAIAMSYLARPVRRVGFVAVQGCASQFQSGLFCDVVRQVLDRFPLPHDNPHVNQFFRLLMPDATPQNADLDLVVDQCWRTDQSVIAHRLRMLESFDVDGALGRLVTPVLAFRCERDILVDGRRIESMARRLPNARMHRFDEAGHFAFVSHAERIAEVISRFARQPAMAA